MKLNRHLTPPALSRALTVAAALPLVSGAQHLPFSPSLRLVSTDEEERTAVLEGRFPPGFRHVLLEESADLGATWQPMVSGPLTGSEATVTFRCPASSERSFFRVRAGADPEVPPAAASGPEMLSVVYEEAGAFLSPLDETTHVLNRIAYGPSPEDFLHVSEIGASAYIAEQLSPGEISEDPELEEAVRELFLGFLPGAGTPLLERGQAARYLKGTQEPPVDWASPSFDDGSWLQGTTGIGYGDDDDATVLDDMRENYLSVYVRQTFTVDDLSGIGALLLDMNYDDGFVAYLNGVEVARENVEGTPPAFDSEASRAAGNIDDNNPSVFDISDFKNLLVTGENVLAIQGHNAGLTSSDFSLDPAISSASEPGFDTIASASNLQHLLHLRGVHSKRQLQAVLAEFWENHFTTDYDKVQDYLEDLGEYRSARQESESAERRIRDQTRFEAATIDYQEYQFLYDNALGYFGDLLLYSATSPSMLIYLDTVENTAENPNENYAREILELSAFGVDNRYTQEDIVELSKCFTGWTVRKIRPEDRAPFPQSVLEPPTTPSVSISRNLPIVDLGDSWRYFPGTSQPPIEQWMQEGFDDSGWSEGPAGFGYEASNDDFAAIANLGTFLDDMRRTRDNPEGYTSVYLRKTLTLPDPAATGDDIAVNMVYDDGYILYLNGTEVRRSRSMRNADEFPAFDDTSSYQHEATADSDTIEISGHPAYRPGAENTIAVHALNISDNSSDFSILPRVLRVVYAPDSIDPVSTEGVWAFRFNPDDHNTEAKVIFPGTEYEVAIPEGRDGPGGVRDALDVIDVIVGHPSTAEFVSVKLVNRFVSDSISLESYKSRTAPVHLLGLVDQCVHAWTATDRPGHIATVLRVIFDPEFKSSPFWSESAHLAKVKTPIEFANSSVRALGGSVLEDDRMRNVIERMGMEFFTRDDPDGYSELGIDWTDTLGFLERMRQAQLLGDNSGSSYARWPLQEFAEDPELQTIAQIIDYFDAVVFGGMLSEERRAAIAEFANTRFVEENGTVTSAPSPFDELTGGTRTGRLRDTIGVILACPEFQLQ